MEEVQKAWHGTCPRGKPIAVFNRKMKATAKALAKWSAQLCNNIALKTAITSELIMRLDTAMDRRQLSEAEHEFRNALKMQRLGLAAMERSLWR